MRKLLFLVGTTLLFSGCSLSSAGHKRQSLNVTSSAFSAGDVIPSEYSCDGKGVNPPLSISKPPDGTKSLALIVDDPDAPNGIFTHWLVWGIEPRFTEIAGNSVPKGAVEGLTSTGKTGYEPPCPPNGSHRYIFRVYALNYFPNLKNSGTREMLETAIQGYILAQGDLVAKYSR